MSEAAGKIETPWLTTAEAAVYLRRSSKALLRLVARGRIKPDCYGKRGKGSTHLFSRDTLDRFVKEE